MDFIPDIVLFIVVLFIMFADRKIWKTYYTPTVLLAVPFLVVWILVLLVGESYNFVSPDHNALWYWIVGLLVFWMFSFPIYAFFKSLGRSNLAYNSIKISFSDTRVNVVDILSIFIILLFLVSFVLSVLKFGINEIGNKDFGKSFAGYGFFGHLRVLSLPILIYHLLTFKDRILLKSLIIFTFLGVMFLYGVKSWIYQPIITFLLIAMWQKQIKIKIKTVVILVVSFFAIFYFTYYTTLVIGKNEVADQNFTNFMIEHFLFYLFSGPLAFSELIYNNIPPYADYRMLLTQFVNIGRLFTGEEFFDPHNQLRIEIVPGTGSNVYTFFGTIYLSLGTNMALLFTIIAGFLYYFLFSLMIVSRKIWITIGLFSLMSYLALGWFDYFLFNIEVLEIPVICVLLEFFIGTSSKIKDG